MTETTKYSKRIAQEILFNPIKMGGNRLCIITTHATPSMASWLLKSYEESKLSDVTIELIIGDVLENGITTTTHDSFKELHGNRYSNKWSNFSCSYLYQPPSWRENNFYIWLQNDNPLKAYECSHCFTQQSFFHNQDEKVRERMASYAYKIYEKVADRSIYCNHSEVEDFVIVKSSDVDVTNLNEENCKDHVVLSLLAKGGETGARSGLNWGQRNKRNKNEAYIPLPSKIAKSGFFPLNKQHFLVVTDDHHTLQLRVEQQNDKAITTPTSNAQLGEYFRNRLGLGYGQYIKKEHLMRYGRTDVSFYKIDDEQYYMDFSVERRN